MTDRLREMTEEQLLGREAQLSVKAQHLETQREDLRREIAMLELRVEDLDDRLAEIAADAGVVGDEIELRHKTQRYRALDAGGEFLACSVLATSMEDADKELESQLTRNESRLWYFDRWVEGGRRIERVQEVG